MKLAKMLGAFFVILSTTLWASQEDNDIWTSLYEGNLSVFHKHYIACTVTDLDEDIKHAIFFSYMAYRHGDFENAFRIFEEIDSYIEDYLISTKE